MEADQEQPSPVSVTEQPKPTNTTRSKKKRAANKAGLAERAQQESTCIQLTFQGAHLQLHDASSRSPGVLMTLTLSKKAKA